MEMEEHPQEHPQENLHVKNGHDRDQNITFNEGPHTYDIAGDDQNKYISVTTLIHKLYPEFNGYEIAKRMISNSKFPKTKQYEPYRYLVRPLQSDDQLVTEILEMWSKNGQDASNKGTIMHKSIEMFFNNIKEENIEQTKEIQYFHNFAKKQVERGLKPFRTEWMIYDDEYKVCGSVDMIFQDSQGLFYIVDWKRSKAIRKWGQLDGYGPLRFLRNCNFNQYSLQLNMYKYILEKHYGIRIQGMSIIVCHPTASDYQEFEIPDLGTLAEECVVHQWFAKCFDLPIKS